MNSVQSLDRLDININTSTRKKKFNLGIKLKKGKFSDVQNYANHHVGINIGTRSSIWNKNFLS